MNTKTDSIWAAVPLQIKAPTNIDGEVQWFVRWIVETPAGRVGAWDRAALEYLLDSIPAQAAPAAVAGPSDEALRLSVDHAHEILRRLMYHRDGDFFINVNRRGAEAIHVTTIATIVHAALVAAPTTQAAPAAQGDAERLDWLLGEGRSMAIDSCDGEYRVVDAKWGLVVTDWMPTPRAAIDAARAAKEWSAREQNA